MAAVSLSRDTNMAAVTLVKTLYRIKGYFIVESLERITFSVRACLHGVGDPGLVGLVSFVFTLWGTQNKRNLPHKTGVPHSM